MRRRQVEIWMDDGVAVAGHSIAGRGGGRALALFFVTRICIETTLARSGYYSLARNSQPHPSYLVSCCGNRDHIDVSYPPPLQHIQPQHSDMSEPGPSSVPTSHDPRSKRPMKRRALSPTSAQASAVTHLFKNPEREIKIPASSRLRSLAAPPEIVANVQGSSAGAGSGEFHVYKASRRREYERLRLMDEEVRQEEEKREFERKRDELKKRDEQKTNKNRRRRMKKKGTGKGDGDKDMTDADSIQQANDKIMNASQNRNPDSAEGRKDEVEAVQQVQDEGGIIIHDDD